MAKEKKKSCFVITPIGDPDSEVRQWSNKIFKHIIKPAVEPNYDPIRAGNLISFMIDSASLRPLQLTDVCFTYSTGYILNTNDYRLIWPGAFKMGELER